MAAPASILSLGFAFRDAKGQIARMRVLIGGASGAAVLTAYNTLQTDLQAVSNAHVHQTAAPDRDFTYGSTGEFQNAVDKAVLTFRDEWGSLHRYMLPAPKAVIFKADLETVDPTQTDMETLITFFQASVYAHSTATAPLAYVGGVRGRKKMIRRFNIWTLDPTLGFEGE